MRTYNATLFSALSLIGALGCDTTPTVTTARLAGASHLVFRCVADGDEGLQSYPLERCGCLSSALNEEGERSLSALSREECLSTESEARLIGYLASETQGRVATIELGASRQVIDIDPTIPGVTHVGVDGLISEQAMHPYGDHLLLLRGPEGALSLLTDHRSLRPERTLELGRGPLLALEVWPKPNEPLPTGGSASYAYVYAPLDGALLELDLDALDLALNDALQADEEDPPARLTLPDERYISRAWSLSSSEGEPLNVSKLSVDPRGSHLVVAHAGEPVITVIDLSRAPDEPEAQRTLSYIQVDGCQDPYFTREVDASCAPLRDWAGEPPACADGLDNDGDGLIDRADPGCERESDQDESLTPELIASPELCEDLLDNDGDGLVDAEDPGCGASGDATRFTFERTPQCSDGIDNDRDGLIDFDAGGAGDPDCLFASDLSETRDQVELGTPQLLTATLALSTGPRSFAYGVSPNGALFSVDLDREALSAELISPPRSPLAVELRRTGALASLFYVTDQSSLESVHLTAPQPLLTPNGAPIYALGALTPDGGAVEASAFYWVSEQRAYELSALEPWLGELPVDPRTQTPSLPLEAAEALADLEPSSLTERPLTLDERRGQGDLQVYLGLGRYPLYQAEWNRLRDAAGQSARVTLPPSLSFNGVPALFNPERHPALCRLIGEEGALLMDGGEGGGGCTLVGELERGGEEPAELRAQRLSSYVSSYEGVLVRQPAPQEELPSAFSIVYEGALPGSLSESGRLSASEGNSWRLVDYEADFCALGVEVGDLFVAEAFEPRDAEARADPSCQPYLQRSPNEGLRPLRYKVTEVRERGLTLTADERVSYEPQLGLNNATVIAKLADPLPPPPARCLASSFRYQLHAGDDEWLVTNNRAGYPHPWISEGGACVERADAGPGDRRARATLGAPYQGPWLRFQLGFRPQQGAMIGVSEGLLPMMVGARFEVNVTTDKITQRLSSVGLLPMELRWLPELDRLYVVDAATQSTAEFDQIDPYTGFMRQVQLFE